MKNLLKEFCQEEEGIATVEVVVLCSILVALAILFQKTVGGKVKDLIDNMFNGLE